MSYRTWLLIAAAGGLIALVLLAVFAPLDPSMLPDDIREHCESQDQPGEEYCTAYRAWVVPALDGISGFLNANSDAITAVATVFIMLFTATLWRANTRLWEASNRSADVAERAIEEQRAVGQAQVKAYLSIKKVAFTLDLSQESPVGIFRVTIVNSGRSPALNAAIIIDVDGVETDYDHVELQIGAVPAGRTITEDDRWGLTQAKCSLTPGLLTWS
jgi:hypothetical protein